MQNAIYDLTGRAIFNFNPTLSEQSPIVVDFDKNGALDLIWTKENMTKVFYGGCNSDSDNDGLCDNYDKIIGNCDNISSNIPSLDLYVNNKQYQNRKFTGKNTVNFKKAGQTILSFNFNFSKRELNLNNIVIKSQNHTQYGSIIIKGIELQENETKTLYMDNLNSSINTVCIKDTEINSINEISTYCNHENEFLVNCNSTIQNRYNCTILGDKFIISGLRNSGAQEQDGDITPPIITIISPINQPYSESFYINLSLNEESDDCIYSINNSINELLSQINSTYFSKKINSSDGYYMLDLYCNDTAGNLANKTTYFLYETSASSGIIEEETSSGASSSGGGIGCNELWNCTDWSPCINATQFRTCSPSLNCGIGKPITKRNCTSLSETNELKESENNKIIKRFDLTRKTEIKNPEQKSLSSITGAAITEPKGKPIVGIIISSLIIFSGFYFYKKWK